jgi:citrate synthase
MSRQTRDAGTIRSNLGRSTPTTVHVRGLDLIEMIGTVSLGDFAYLELRGRLPDARESLMFNAIVVALVEHGLTPSALVSRLTALGAPESLQGAVAAGLLGLGNTFVGTIEGAASICQASLPPHVGRRTDQEIAELATQVLTDYAARRAPVPGIGHPVHTPVDPRAQKLFALAREQDFDDEPIRLMEEISRQASAARGRILPVNATGAIGAIAMVLGIPANIARGLGVMARAIGLVAHLLEEQQSPLAATVWSRAERESTTDS